ncbi:type VI secretion system baseplate subunit TssG [Litoribacillus peritrichatus]|uniref:Type VI secretion system baseplate subunit TssG n=1 Tax=Litoribacillus peritrichatus TaxID=718191 RepID=A0ABP7M9X9_9GAMM
MSLDLLLDEPSEFDFYQAVYQIERQLTLEDKEWLFVGTDSFPDKEIVRFKSEQHLGFPGRPISKAEVRSEADGLTSVDMHVSFMGLTGPSGVLPRHYSELILKCIKNRDTAMRDFFDLFNHRLISLNYRAWKKYRMATHYERGGKGLTDPFSKALIALTGSTESLHIYYGGLLNKANRSAEGLRCLLLDFLDCPVVVEELQGKWVKLAPADQTRLASRDEPEGQYARLGCEATVGSRIWDISSGIKVIVSPSESEQVKNLLPGSPRYRKLKMLIESYVDNGLEVKLEVRAKLNDLPNAELSVGKSSLGQSARLANRPINNQQYMSI